MLVLPLRDLFGFFGFLFLLMPQPFVLIATAPRLVGPRTVSVLLAWWLGMMTQMGPQALEDRRMREGDRCLVRHGVKLFDHLRALTVL